jgi:hypothetical protein
MRLCSHGHAVTLLYIAVLVTSDLFFDNSGTCVFVVT